MSDYQLIVIGAGPGGYTAALQAAKRGLHTAVVERREVGGTCLNRGCIPTKTLLHASQVYRDAVDGAPAGVHAGDITFDLAEMFAYKRGVSEKLRGGIHALLKGARVDLLEGTARIDAPGRVTVTGPAGETAYTADRLLIATGSVPVRPPIPGLDLPGVMTSDQLLEGSDTLYESLVIMGGGVIGDLAGFAAASYLRGIKLVQIPTSLLAQVDSSVGGKVAVDLPQGKNLVGAFFHPRLVLIDPDVLDTLPERYITDGMGEVIKYGCIKDAALFETLSSCSSFDELKDQLTSIIYRCVDIKRIVVEADQFDTGDRMLLNFGHTLAHTIEQYYHYESESHGEAVSIGMYQITKLSEEAGLTAPGEAERIGRVLKAYGLPCECGLPVSSLLDAIKLDKKNLDNHLNVILLHAIGDSYIYPTNLDFFKTAGVI